MFLQHTETDCRWGIWQMDETPSDLCRAFAGTTLYEEAQQRFASPRRCQEWLSARLLLWHLLGERQPLASLPSGKPVLEDGSCHISLSHTNGYAAAIVASFPVGIDIEQYGQRVHRVAGRFMRSDEQVFPYHDDDTWSLLLHWSAKEAMFKCMDASEVDFRSHLHIFPFQPQEQGVMHAEEYRTSQQRTFRIRYLLHPDFVLTYTVLALNTETPRHRDLF